MRSITLTEDNVRDILRLLSRFNLEGSENVTICTEGQKIEIVFNTTVNGIQGLFKVDLIT